MKLNFLKILYERFKQFLIENNIAEASLNESDKNFNMYVEHDLKLSLELLKNGYIGKPYQLNNLEKKLLHSAKNDSNFLFLYSNYANFISSDVFITFLLNHDLGKKCKNEKTVEQNFKHIFSFLSTRNDFGELFNSKIIDSINNLTQKTINIKPKYEAIHAFNSNQEDLIYHSKLCANIYNALIIFPLTFKNLNDFVLLKSTICTSIIKVTEYIQSHNVRIIDLDNQVLHYNNSNKKIFNIEIMQSWKKYIEDYDISAIKSNAMSEMINNQSTNSQKDFDNSDSVEFDYQINILKMKLNDKFINQIDNIQLLYKTIYHDLFEKKENNELNNLYKELPTVLEKFTSIHPDYRNSLRNIEGKNPEELMEDSLNSIERKFTEYLRDINLDKVSDLSITQRVIKMKT